MKILVSACLVGENCKYDGKNNLNSVIVNYLKNKDFIALCPEMLAGLGTPREPVELLSGRVTTKDGTSLQDEFMRGVKLALQIAIDEGIDLAILQSRSPSCGVSEIYDGTFSKRLIAGSGLFATSLKEQGIEVVDVDKFKDLICFTSD